MENAEEAQRFLAGYGWQASPEPHFDKRVVHPLAEVTDVSCNCFPSLYLLSSDLVLFRSIWSTRLWAASYQALLVHQNTLNIGYTASAWQAVLAVSSRIG